MMLAGVERFNVTSTAVNLIDGAWHHIYVQLTSSIGNYMYVDGVLRGSSTGNNFSLSNVNTSSTLTFMRLGASTLNTTTITPSFYMDNVEIFDKILPIKDVVLLANRMSGNTLSVPNLRLPGATNEDCILRSDLSGNARWVTSHYIEVYCLSFVVSGTITPSPGFYAKISAPLIANPILDTRYWDFTSVVGRVIYLHPTTSMVKCSMSFTMWGPSAGSSLLAAIYKNGTLYTPSTASVATPTGNLTRVHIQILLQMDTNDYIELYVTNTSNTTSPAVQHLNIIMECC
jgi:hypothetical protein